MASILRKAAGSTALWLATMSTTVAQTPDHLECYKVKDPQVKASYHADVAGLVAEPGCVIKVPGQLFCTQTTKSNVDPVPPGGADNTGSAGRFLCYKLKCPRSSLPTVAWHDQFGTRTLTAKRTSVICAPEIVAVTSTTTSSTTTTTGCMVEHAPCGSCGTGLCLYNCPTASLVCVANGFLGPGCSSDTDCADSGYPVCIGSRPGCMAGTDLTGCAIPCP